MYALSSFVVFNALLIIYIKTKYLKCYFNKNLKCFDETIERQWEASWPCQSYDCRPKRERLEIFHCNLNELNAV